MDEWLSFNDPDDVLRLQCLATTIVIYMLNGIDPQIYKLLVAAFSQGRCNYHDLKSMSSCSKDLFWRSSYL